MYSTLYFSGDYKMEILGLLGDLLVIILAILIEILIIKYLIRYGINYYFDKLTAYEMDFRINDLELDMITRNEE